MKVKNVELTFDEFVNGVDTIFAYSNYMFLKLDENERNTLIDKEYVDGAFADKATSILFNGGKLIIINTYEIDDDSTQKEIDENTYTLTKESINNAVTKISEKYPKIFSDIMNENDDYFTWDAVFQVAMFDEIVYG